MDDEEFLIKLGISKDTFNDLVNLNLFQNDWNIYKDYWKEIQKRLEIGKISPFTGQIFKNKFKSHLSEYGWDALRWYYEYNNEPIGTKHYCTACGKEVKFYDRSFYFPSTCSKQCAGHNRGLLTGGTSCSEVSGFKIVSKELASKYGWTEEHRIQHNNLVPIIRNTGYKPGYQEHLIGELLDKLNIRYIKQYPVIGTSYKADYYLPDYNYIIEEDGKFKWNNGVLDDYYVIRANEITEKTGILVKNIYQYDVDYYENNLDEFKKLIENKDTTRKPITYVASSSTTIQ